MIEAKKHTVEREQGERRYQEQIFNSPVWGLGA